MGRREWSAHLNASFGHDELQFILQSCTIPPAVNMILLHPANLAQMRPTLDLMEKHRVVPGAYSSLKPLWANTNESELVKVTQVTAQKRGCKPEQVLLRWCHQKG